ncbi:MAG: hypothetical protein IKU29_00765 [Parabacteroides sp.]|nr:hypothetical protein [Parabacteroides sp.]
MGTYNKQTIVYSNYKTFDCYDTSVDEDNIGWQILDSIRENVKNCKDIMGFTCNDYTVIFTPTGIRSETITLLVNILSNKTIVIVLGIPDFEDKDVAKWVLHEIKEKLEYL